MKAGQAVRMAHVIGLTYGINTMKIGGLNKCLRILKTQLN